MSLRWSAEKEMIFAVESLALGGVPGSARPTTARTANPIPVAASNFLPFASATATFPPPLVVTDGSSRRSRTVPFGYPHRDSQATRMGTGRRVGDSPAIPLAPSPQRQENA